MEITLRLPTQDQYAFIEAKVEVNNMEQAVDAYFEAMKLLKPKEGIPAKEWNAWLDRYLTENTGDLDVYQRMSQWQQSVVQELKKAFKRMKVTESDEMEESKN